MINNNGKLKSELFEYQQTVLNIYNDRREEIELFFGLIEKLENVNPSQLISIDENIHKIQANDLLIKEDNVELTVRNLLRKLNVETPQVDMSNILKANSILLLYNLIESTISNSDRFIVKSISDANILYSQATEKIKTLYIEHTLKFNKSSNHIKTALSLLDNIQHIVINVEKQYNDNEKEFQGSIDCQMVDILLDKYGIEVTKIAMLTKETERTGIRNVKMWRNDLAHGKYSFAELGRDKLRYNTSERAYKESDILFLKKSCFIFLEITLRNIEKYIENSAFKI